MRIRHKVPSIFSLSMVDMLCCALGCVILVWLLNAKQAEDTAAEQRDEIATVMDRARSDREESQRLLSEARGEQEKAAARLRSLSGERDNTMKEMSDLKRRIVGYEGNVESLRKQLAGERARAKELADKLKLSEDRLTMLEADLRTGKTRLDEERKKVAGLSKQAGEKDETLKGARAELMRKESALKGLLDDIRAERDKLRAERERAEKLEKAIELTRAEKEKVDALLKDDRLAKEKVEKTLVEVTRREQELLKQMRDRKDAVEKAMALVARLERDKRDLQSVVESRFAGIELAGERVVFLIDSSGSMMMIDDKTDAPLKWLEVRRTVAKLMESLPKLTKFQVVTFGPTLKYPLGNDGRWIDYKKESPVEVLKALEATKPSGGTNMYIGFDAAFGFRKEGLDTVYLLSDGLPNQGEGLTPQQSRTLDGVERGVALGKHVRSMLKQKWNAPIEGKRQVKIHTIGFFYESPDLGAFLWALARENDGSFVGMSRP